ncbi:MAG: radical SAM family heme chaperone HemW [Bryobacteraceae bacterium]|nr:radical SAM family heme chaperone HemW [Bryobacteraceae bacterium]
MPGVYISWPFCPQKCTYCNFASGVFPAELQARYLERLIEELRGHEWQWTPETVYLGGGTPGSMPEEALERVLSLVPGRPWKEATLEAAPGAITAAEAKAWMRCGIGRVSLGVQSFAEEELRRTGRRHTAEGVERDVRALREAGIGNINIDLIAGLPAQTEAGWRKSLEWLRRLEPPHVSVYMLEIDEDSRLGREILSGGGRFGAAAVPPEDRIADFYEMAVDFLENHGWRRYEISNFARPGFESRHNLKYWRLEPYAGFGADAHSFDGVWRAANTDDVRAYAERGPMPERTQADLAGERYLTGLRLMEGVEFREEDEARFGAAVRRFLDLGLLERHGPRIRLTRRGVMLSNEVFEAFL